MLDCSGKMHRVHKLISTLAPSYMHLVSIQESGCCAHRAASNLNKYLCVLLLPKKSCRKVSVARLLIYIATSLPFLLVNSKPIHYLLHQIDYSLV